MVIAVQAPSAPRRHRFVRKKTMRANRNLLLEFVGAGLAHRDRAWLAGLRQGRLRRRSAEIA
jgi:hypothetical protein